MTGSGGAPHTGMWSSPEDLVGSVLADRYQVQRVIGDGGMGSVFLAEHVTLRKKVALKVLHPELCRDQNHVDRFLQEARAASMISHENIVDIVDFGPVPGGSVFFAMEFLEGSDLAGTLRRDGRMPWPRVQNFMLQIVRALNAAHNKGIIHRDLKPANCFVITKGDGREFIKLLDFGIAKVTDAENDKALTRTGAVFGTAKYMAPEQACGEPADNRTDIYAAAVVMYELLTGIVPFDGDNFMRVLSRHLTEPLTLPSTMAPDAGIPPVVEAIVVKALSKKREDRYQNMLEFEQALLALGPDGTPRAGRIDGIPYPMHHHPSGVHSVPISVSDAPGHTQWLSADAQGSQNPPSQAPDARGGTLLLDNDSVTPGFANQPAYKGPTDWSPGGGGTVVMDGMGQDVLPTGSSAIAIARPPSAIHPAVSAGTPAPPDTYGPTGADPTNTSYPGPGEASWNKGFIALVLGGGVLAAVLGGVVVWNLLGEPPTPPTNPVTTAVPTTRPPREAQAEIGIEPEPINSSPDEDEPSFDDPSVEAAAAGSSDGADETVLTASGSTGEPETIPETVPEPTPVTPEPTPPASTPRPPRPPKVVSARTTRHIEAGFSRASRATKQCGGKYGAIPGQRLTVEATINGAGRIVSATVSGPSRTSPLGKCVVKVVKDKARFVQSKEPLQIGKRYTYKM